ncbi:hypothetical protein A3A93_02740 [Candidatus Roizmanbacteria bacterium RIFCSPLOWO2_01_FULL_38_12]|uniref:RmlD-like substrate binding domain-containing protein n=1 Tax=Candidatus Roizmanbacteria bacterium RIFCSPLOWO2_01_FULL_38_12 TaxID=1802061 RepID=A0A1F7IUI2_9BACT|nr:MAG: hypothetical protein A2861_02640 [Candidatus Roizmanbacteria bacterium RIFCSPHIGHO2_01_FULL_38_15]OGK34343.1 MAG: hypothetical protein A3F59_04865 [Candidatus Roizmanbacteria bacterium RIFCSPHIGHO2_12_FULL_38_13]OGK47014.1 MAG: hypothetical protein A3A93_02740 [Candidatus Roizmanbacteria bacterium RIFCSPLOWO2_01_FULL_38_12]
MKKVLITGASGMLGATLVSLWQDKYTVFATGGSDFPANPARNYKVFDLSQDNYRDLAKVFNPEYIIHSAAMTNVELCERIPQKAMNTNGESVKKLLDVFTKSKLIFISSDKVFAPNTHLATEKDPVNPTTVYGKSKVLGEKYILQSPTQSMSVRTVIVGKNINKNKNSSLAEWIVNSLLRKQHITLFSDVVFTPISIWHFASELSWLIENYSTVKNIKILHIAGAEIISKYDFGYNLAKKLKLDTKLITQGSIEKLTLMINTHKDLTLDSKEYEKLSCRMLPKSARSISILVKNFINRDENFKNR